MLLHKWFDPIMTCCFCDLFLRWSVELPFINIRGWNICYYCTCASCSNVLCSFLSYVKWRIVFFSLHKLDFATFHREKTQNDFLGRSFFWPQNSEKRSHLFWRLLSSVKTSGIFLQNFVAFSENLNFKRVGKKWNCKTQDTILTKVELSISHDFLANSRSNC